MEKSASLGANRTGIDASPIHSKEMQSGAQHHMPGAGNTQALDSMRLTFIEEAERLGSVPVPATAKGLLKSMMEKFAGNQPATFVNKLGERLAFERSGIRIYESLMLKCEVAKRQGKMDFQVPMERVRQFHEEEGEHFAMLIECMNKLGVDPTAETPDADASGVATSGLMKVIQDPRSSLSQCLEAMLSIEMTDNAAWELLVQLADDLGQDEMAQRFRKALAQEQVHMQEVRSWYTQSVRNQASPGKTH